VGEWLLELLFCSVRDSSLFCPKGRTRGCVVSLSGILYMEKSLWGVGCHRPLTTCRSPYSPLSSMKVILCTFFIPLFFFLLSRFWANKCFLRPATHSLTCFWAHLIDFMTLSPAPKQPISSEKNFFYNIGLASTTGVSFSEANFALHPNLKLLRSKGSPRFPIAYFPTTNGQKTVHTAFLFFPPPARGF